MIRSVAALPLLPAFTARAATAVHVYKNASCECCVASATHFSRAGFAVEVTTTEDTAAVRKRLGIPDAFGACHTATVEGYAIEGHVPAVDIRRLLSSKPRAIGLAVPSMPPGSPGMEYGDRKDLYRVFLIDRQGRGTVFASYPKLTRRKGNLMKSPNLLLSALLLATVAVNAQMPAEMAMPTSASAPAAGAFALTEGVVQNLDKPRGMVTLKHGEIANMGMPAMTMSFNVREKKMLDQVKTGDRVRFHVENVSGAPTVTRMEVVQ